MIEYDCHHHRQEYIDSLPTATERNYARLFHRMIICKFCGNKRCPHASDCRLNCTGSNEPGQPGSVY